jgi:hypothetical protein
MNIELVKAQSLLHVAPESMPPEKRFFHQEAKWNVQKQLNARTRQSFLSAIKEKNPGRRKR